MANACNGTRALACASSWFGGSAELFKLFVANLVKTRSKACRFGTLRLHFLIFETGLLIKCCVKCYCTLICHRLDRLFFGYCRTRWQSGKPTAGQRFTTEYYNTEAHGRRRGACARARGPIPGCRGTFSATRSRPHSNQHQHHRLQNF